MTGCTTHISRLVSQYRKLKAERDALDAEMSEIKAQLTPMVEAEGKWEDALGYAKLNERKPTVSYPGVSVDRLAQTWAESMDPVMQSCGSMLLDLRNEQVGYTYLQVK